MLCIFPACKEVIGNVQKSTLEEGSFLNYSCQRGLSQVKTKTQFILHFWDEEVGNLLISTYLQIGGGMEGCMSYQLGNINYMGMCTKPQNFPRN